MAAPPSNVHPADMGEATFEDVRDRLFECSDGEAVLADGFEAALIFPVKFICSDPDGRDPRGFPAPLRRHSWMNHVIMRAGS